MGLATHEHEWTDAFEHEAFFYAGLDDFLAGTVPFVREGVAADEAVLVAVPRQRMLALQDALGPDAASVSFADMEEIGRNPAHIIPAWREFLDERGAGEQRVRGIGEPIWAGRSDDELVECQRHEALLNVAFLDSGSWQLMCPYDTVHLPAAVLEEARRSHPWVRAGASARESSAHCRHVDEMAEPFRAPLVAAPADALSMEFSLDDIPRVRHLVATTARGADLADDAVDDLVLAAHEVATNSVRHAGGRGTVKVWSDGSAVRCEIADRGRILDPLAGRERPRNNRPGGRGLWMANQLCDLVQVRTDDHGNVIRLHMRRP